MSILKTWVDNARWISLPQSILPAITALILALTQQTDGFQWYLAIMAVFGVVFLHLGMNLFDDYFDYRYKKVDYRNELAAKGMRARLAKCAYLEGEGGKNNLKQLLIASIGFVVLATILGVFIYLQRGNFILYLSIVCFVLCIEYSAPPLRLSYYGLGELSVGLIFGPLLMIGVYYTSCGSVSQELIIPSIAIGMLVANILFTHSVLDLQADKYANKKTLAVVLNDSFWVKRNIILSKNLMLSLCFIFIFSPFLIIGLGIVLSYISLWYLAVLLTLRMAIGLFSMMFWFYKDDKKAFEHKQWMGPFQQWEQIKEGGIEWFMFRWLVARNYISIFCFIIIAINICEYFFAWFLPALGA